MCSNQYLVKIKEFVNLIKVNGRGRKSRNKTK